MSKRRRRYGRCGEGGHRVQGGVRPGGGDHHRGGHPRHNGGEPAPLHLPPHPTAAVPAGEKRLNRCKPFAWDRQGSESAFSAVAGSLSVVGISPLVSAFLGDTYSARSTVCCMPILVPHFSVN